MRMKHQHPTPVMLWAHCVHSRNAMEGIGNHVRHVLGQSPARPRYAPKWPAGDRRGARSTCRRGAMSSSHRPRPEATSNLLDGPSTADTADNHDNVYLIMPSSGDWGYIEHS